MGNIKGISIMFDQGEDATETQQGSLATGPMPPDSGGELIAGAKSFPPPDHIPEGSAQTDEEGPPPPDFVTSASGSSHLDLGPPEPDLSLAGNAYEDIAPPEEELVKSKPKARKASKK